MDSIGIFSAEPAPTEPVTVRTASAAAPGYALPPADLDPTDERRALERAEEEYEYQYPHTLPEGWSVAVYPDGTAILCSPGTCPRELGGRATAVATVEDAVEGARAVLAVEEE